MTVSSAALRLLDAIEKIEIQSLAWGFTDGSLSEDELFELAGKVADGGGVPEDLIEELLDAKVMFEHRSGGSNERYRSRFAEMVRLLAASRQLFVGKPWQSAPRLVADFRVDRRPRRFPCRDRAPQAVLKDNAGVLGATGVRQELWTALTSSRGGFLLSSFQERTTARLLGPAADTGTIVTAGTGSGKTLAVYLPALIRIGEAIGADHWVKVLAVYPRTELLKDQFAEAYRNARSIDAVLMAKRLRPVRIGALFGATPNGPSTAEVDKKWQRRGADFVCPWLRCPACDGELLWRGSDVEAQREELRCANGVCARRVPESHIALTRETIQKRPPDILFTTTEMLNQRMSDHWTRHLFGIGLPFSKKPFMALLDEVHTYEGATGAQIALTLRRWRHLLGAPVTWAGLSATLAEAPTFFADLTGVAVEGVVEITPREDEIEERGADYQLLLRGDPASRASLLSTSIQAAMLVARSLDPPQRALSHGLFGRRAFLFTDDLDVTNRLYDDIRDAEGYDWWGKPKANVLPLASLRAGGVDAVLRDLEGQRWRMCEDIGHPLDQRLIVGRTTSQDSGVNMQSNIVVATAALEVGYNDPHVGAVIQHKAPRGMASFLQRKGRAGRQSTMRPITITVLSDYGRDRALYQAYEHLFDPSLQPQHLPVKNLYVLKMQAVFSFIDWLADRTVGPEKAWLWDILSRPHPQPSAAMNQVLVRVRALLLDVLNGKQVVIADLRSFISEALCIDEPTMDIVLWRAPRSILLEAAPTLARRLFRQWELAFSGEGNRHDHQVDYHPLPDFVPRNLFSDLSLPEVQVSLPAAQRGLDERMETMPILQALRQFAPGRVTRRFAFERAGLSHWVPVDPATPFQLLQISDFAEEFEYVGSFRANCNSPAEKDAIRVYRPWTVRMQPVPKSVLPSSNAFLSWRSELSTNGDPMVVPVPPRSSWRTYARSVSFHLHRFRASVTVRRFAAASHANVRTRQDDFAVTVGFQDAEGPAAVGFALEVDGFYVDLSLPSVAELVKIKLPAQLASSAWTGFLKESFRSDENLPVDLNDFQRDWLFQIFLSAICGRAGEQRSLSEAASEILAEDRLQAVLHEVMSELFDAVPPLQADDENAGDDDDPVDGLPNGNHHQGQHGITRLQRGLSDQIARPEVRACLRALARRFDEREDEAYGHWLRRTVLDTLGEALLQACMTAAPRHAAVEGLLVDIQDDSDSGTSRIWLTETTLGGAGVIQAFADRFASEPRVLFNALEAALSATDLELVDDGLRRVVELSLSDAEFAERLTSLRAAEGHKEFGERWRVFAGALAGRGAVDLSHALTVSLTSRLLRSGSGPALDALLLHLLERWDAVESGFGITIGLREFSYICAKDLAISAEVRKFLAKLPGPGAARVSVIAAVSNLLWPRAAEVRLQSLQSYNPYRGARATDPALVRSLLLSETSPQVDFSETSWKSALNAALEKFGSVRLVASGSAAPRLRSALIDLAATPVDVGFLQFFPTVERVERISGNISVSLVLREQV
ncbi:hypothetical protein ABID59_004350 [Bradyrhizobium sp. S3.3.6]|uniref:protein DpdJ n=1 Tax=Bradyrhizobium sp. S3.3.6 TaxID=3156429 RepID=UPI00339273B6